MRPTETTSTDRRLWFGFLAGPIAWSLHELVSYVLVKVACETGFGLLLHLVTLATLALAGAGMYVALKRHGARIEPPRAAADFLSGAGFLVSALFGFAILMEGVPSAVVNACL